MNQVLALTGKDLLLLVRDKAGFFFTFAFPLVYCIFFGTIFAGSGRDSGAIPITIVDEDGTNGSRAFSESLSKTKELKVDQASREQAATSVRKGNRTAYIALPKGFGEARERMFWGGGAKLEVGIDPSRQAESGMLQGLLMQSAFEKMQDMFSNPEVMSAQVKKWTTEISNSSDVDPMWKGALQLFLPALETFVRAASHSGDDGEGGGAKWQPIDIETVEVTRQRTGPRNAYEISFPQGATWGLLSCAAAFGISLVTERLHGTLTRLRLAPIGQWHILSGKGLACFTSTIGMQVVMFLVGILVFKIRPHSYPLLLLAIVSASLCFVGIMMFLSVLGRTEQSAAGIGWAVLMAMAMLGGGMMPLFFMPKWLQTMSHISPVKWAILAMEGSMFRQFSLSEMALPCGILLAVGVGCFALGARVFEWAEDFA